MYSRAAIEAAQQHAVVSMYEPKGDFPECDPAKRICTDPAMPLLLFTRRALDVILKYLVFADESARGVAPHRTQYIEPVLSE